MSYRNRRLRSAVACALGAAGGLLAFGSTAHAAEPTQAELLQQIDALRAKVEKLEANQNATTQRLDSREVDATVDNVLKDAEGHSQFMQAQGFMGGYSKGKFLLQDESGNFVLHPWLQFMPRWVANDRQDAKNAGDDDDFQSGFELRRMKFGFDGNVFGPETTYLFNWATDRNSGTPTLEEGWVRYAFAKQFAIKGGQFKDPFAHESLVSSKKLLVAERTLLTDNFTGGDNFVQGVSLAWDDGPEGYPLRAEVAYHDGSNGPNQNFQDFPTTKANWGAAARIEYLAFGKWSQYDDFTPIGNENDVLVFGAGVDYTEAGDTETFLHTVDAQYERGALGLYAAYYGRAVEDAKFGTGAAAHNENLYDWGVIAQGSYLLNDKWEPFGRYSYIRFDQAGLAASAENEVHEITAGVNYYIHGHNMKFTADFTYLPNGTPVADSGADILANDGNAEYVFRAQFQLLL